MSLYDREDGRNNLTMRFFHTSDWHLGQSLYGQSREYEHAAFLSWLLDQISLHRPDALLIAGDVFDTVNPPISAQEQLYQFLADAHIRLPSLQIIMIAGNHDSGSRIELPAPLLSALNTHVIGKIRWQNRQIDLDGLLIPIRVSHSSLRSQTDLLTPAADGWCLALPYLRPAEITATGLGEGDVMRATQQVYEDLIDRALARADGQPVILMTHAHLMGGQMTEDSERNIVIGTVEALSTALFPASLVYVALGHLHRPQQVGSTHIRYSGAPIPLSFSEQHYPHQILYVSLIEGELPQIEPLLVPRCVEIRRMSGELAEVLAQIRALNLPVVALEAQPLLEVTVYPDVQGPFPPDLRHQIETALPVDAVRLVRVRKGIRTARKPEDQTHTVMLEEQTPESLYRKLWAAQGHIDDQEVFADFAQLVDALDQSETHQG